MNETQEGFEFEAGRAPYTYELRVGGRLGSESASWFEDMTVTVDSSTSPAQTIIHGAVGDEAALYGLISRIRDLGLTLLSVNRTEEE